MPGTIYTLQFPIGEYDPPAIITPAQREEWIDEMAQLPYNLKAVVMRLTDEQLKMCYRPGGWTAAQVIHHIADSHLNSYIRFKWALTEDRPTIKPYDEKLWAEMPDGRDLDIEVSVLLVEQLHIRLVKMLRNLGEEAWSRSFHHPETGKDVALDWNLGMYAWHGRHHLAHLQLILQ